MADFFEILGKRTWAVVGASNDCAKYGHIIWRFLKDRGYNVYPVNPREKKICEDVCYPTIADLPEKPDVVSVIVPPKIAQQIVAQCGAEHIKYVWLQPGAESEEAVEIGRKAGICVITDACVLIEMRKGR